jgi:4-amino-4-deoxy-L-arabinose transferase-like glycosyltransferase
MTARAAGAQATDTRLAAIATGSLWLLLVAVALYSRPPLAIDETRYLTVAWEMHQADHWLVPLLNGEAYHHKPPLLFWIIRLGWLVFGVSEIWARLVAPLFGLLALGLTAVLGRLLWSGQDGIRSGNLAAPLLLSSAWWMQFTTMTFFDLLVACSALLGWIGLTLGLHRGRILSGMIIVGLAIGLGVLSKGPVILVFVLPPALLAPLWAIPDTPLRWTTWYAGLAGAILLGATIGLAWALPAAKAGGPVYEQALLWGQTAGRMAESFAHRRPFWWYLPLLPLLLFPWSLWPPLWRMLRPQGRRIETGLRFVLVVCAAGLLVFSLISGKQPHYLLPLFPLLALAAARGITATAGYRHSRHDLLLPAAIGSLIALGFLAFPFLRKPLASVMRKAELPAFDPANGLLIAVPLLAGILAAWWLAGRKRPGADIMAMILLPVSLFLSLHLGGFASLRAVFDLAPAAAVIRQGQDADRPIAYLGNYHGEFQFLGRLQQPLAEIETTDIDAWLRNHPRGWLVMQLPRSAVPADAAWIYTQRSRNRQLVICDAATCMGRRIIR